MVLRHSSSVTLVFLAAVALISTPSRVPRIPDRVATRAPTLPCPLGPAGPNVLGPIAADVNYAVSVTPVGSSVSWPAYTGGLTSTFTVTNTGTCQDTYSFTKTATGTVSGVTLDKSSASLPPGASTTVVATYSVGAVGTGVLTLMATGSIGGETDAGYFNVTSLSNGPVISVAPHNSDYRNPALCVEACFDAVVGYATPPYFSMDVRRSVQLAYTSAQARPQGVVQVDATDTSSVAPVKMSLRLQGPDATFVTFTNGSQEIFFSWAPGANRLAAQFDASTLASGAYAYTVVVRSYRADASVRENYAAVRVLIANEQSSPFGAGWSIAGFQRLIPQADSSIAITEGNGSIGYFARASCSPGCTYTAPKGDFSAVTSVSSVGADSAKYYRRYPDGTTFAFRADGRLWYVKDRLNNQMQFRYNASNLLVAITDPAGQTDSLGYSASNKLAWIKDPGGRRDSITVNASGDLTQITDWAGGFPFQGNYGVGNEIDNSGCEVDVVGWAGAWGSETLIRDNAHAYEGLYSCKVTTVNLGGSGHWNYLRNGLRLPAVAGQTYTYSLWVYSDGGATGKTFVLGINWWNNVPAYMSYSGGATVALVNGWQRFSFTATAPAGTVSCQPLFTTAGAEGVFTYWADAAVFTNGAPHQLVNWSDRRGGSWGFAYDFAGKIASETAPRVTMNGQGASPLVRFASIEKTILIDPASGLGTPTNPGASVDTAAVRASTTNARGFTTTYGLDRFGAPTLVQEPLGRTTTFTRDSSSRTVRAVSPSGHKVKYTFSGPDLTQQWDSTTGQTINYTYESTYHQVTLVYGDVDSLVNRWTAGRLDSSRVGGSSSWTKYRYTSTGRDSLVTDPGGHTTAFFYHATGFMNTDSTVLGGLTPTSYQCDGHGQRTLVAHHFATASGIQYDTTWIQYDSVGRVVRRIGPLHDTTTTTYDALFVTQVRDAKGWVHRSWPNALGWADSTSDPAGALDRVQYDSAGNRRTWTNRRGQVVQFTYDSLDQARFVIVGSDTTKFFADPLGRFSTVSNRESVDTIKADTAGRPIWEISCRVLPGSSAAKCFRDSSAYQIRNLRTNLIARADSVWGPSVQRAVRWHYDNSSNLDTLTNFGGESTRFGYNVEHLMSGITLSGLNGMLISYDYPWSHVTDIIQLTDSSVNASLGRSYQFDAGQRVEVRYHGLEVTPDWNRTYSYDAAGRLVGYADSAHTYAPNGGCSRHLQGETCSGYQTATLVGSAAYFYDSLGNRKDSARAVGGIDPGNRLRRLTNLRMDYDAAGNLLAKRTLNPSDTTQVWRRDSLFWSAVGGLDSVHVRDSQGALTRIGFGYDGWGRRVRKTVGTLTTRHLWDGDALLMDLDSAGNRLAEYTYYPGADNPHSVLRHDRGDTTYYYVKDLPGNITGLVKRTATGVAVANQYDYSPFGTLATSSAPVPNRLLYAGRESDDETQLYYNRARYYDPAVGRFISEDPARLSAGMNLYAYAGNDPMNGRDPSGLCGTSGDPETWNPKSYTESYGGCVNADHLAELSALDLLGDIVSKGLPNIDTYCDASGCRQGSTLSKEVCGVTQWPISSGGTISSGYGMRVHPIRHTWQMHAGIDIAAAEGTAVQAAGWGIVVLAGSQRGYGMLVAIYHPAGFLTMYGHLRDVTVVRWAIVEAGDVIGHVGSTGESTGPHLHFEVRTQYGTVDPTVCMS